MAKKSTSVIRMAINDSEDLYSTYSTENNIVLNNEAVAFLESELKGVESKDNIKIVIETPTKISDERKNKCVKSIKNHFKGIISEAKDLIKRYLIIALIMFVATCLLATLQILGNKFGFPDILMIFLEILTWVFGWEFIDILVFSVPIKKHKTKKYAKIINAKFEFVVKKNNEEK